MTTQIQSGEKIRHKEQGTEAMVLDPDNQTFEENGYEVLTLEDNINRFLPRSEFENWEVITDE